MLGIGFGEFTLIVLVLIIVLGPERLPGFMKGVGKGLRSLRQASRDIRTAVGIDEMLRDDVSYQPPRRRPEPPKGPAPVSRADLAEASPNASLPSVPGAEDAIPAWPEAVSADTAVANVTTETAPSEAEAATDPAATPTGMKER